MQDYNTEYEEYLESQESKPEFIIDNAQKANWAVGIIKNEKILFDTFEEVALAEIERLKKSIENEREKFESKTGFLKYSLMNFMDTAPSKETKTQISLTLPAGKIVRKKESFEFVGLNDKPINSDPDVLKYCEETDVDNLVKVEKKVNWANLKKSLTINESNKVVNSETGEVLECIKVSKIPMKLEIK